MVFDRALGNYLPVTPSPTSSTILSPVCGKPYPLGVHRGNWRRPAATAITSVGRFKLAVNIPEQERGGALSLSRSSSSAMAPALKPHRLEHAVEVRTFPDGPYLRGRRKRKWMEVIHRRHQHPRHYLVAARDECKPSAVRHHAFLVGDRPSCRESSAYPHAPWQCRRIRIVLNFRGVPAANASFRPQRCLKVGVTGNYLAK